MALTASISSASSGIRYVEKGAYSRITWLRLGLANPDPNPNRNPNPSPNPNQVPFYERMGFVRVGAVSAVASKKKKKVEAEEEAEGKKRKPKDELPKSTEVSSRVATHTCDNTHQTSPDPNPNPNPIPKPNP